MHKPNIEQFDRLFKEDAVWGEQEVIKFRWVLISVILVFIGYIYYSGETDRALTSLLLATVYIFYNAVLNILLRKYGSATWIRFLSSTIDITILSIHIFNYSFLFKPIAVTTAASVFLYPVLILLSVLRYDRRLVVFSALYSVLCFNIIYSIRYPYIEPELFDKVASANWAGQIYKSAYMLVMGYFLYSIPKMINRLNAKHQATIELKRSSELNLALEKQKNELAVLQLHKEKRLNKKLADQKSLIEQQKEALQHANMTKDKLFSIIGHDLKSPFAAQTSIIELILADYSQYNKEEIKDILKTIKHSAHQGLDLLGNLLDWSKQQNNLIKHQLTPVRLSTMVNDAQALLSHNIAHKGITLINKVDSMATVCADGNMIKTILRNILSNAIKYTNNNGTIQITSNTEGNFDLLKIKDSGIGMTEDQISRLYNIENNISTPGTNNEPGTGLGLLLCKELAEKNKAEIRIESKVGEGSTFTIAFPRLNLETESQEK
ncbi:sensor histidine kinase [Carboxylicivirga sp. RSCT41]|uniref:sensor histidine kinase n=1 Tax=Carboxylicivirga agarovorans TaxID=3417570 RepID=UPI003D3508E0